MAAGNATVWKPSPSTPLCSIAVTKIVAGVLEKNGVPGAVAGLVTGGKDVGDALVQSRDVDMGEGSTSLDMLALKITNFVGRFQFLSPGARKLVGSLEGTSSPGLAKSCSS